MKACSKDKALSAEFNGVVFTRCAFVIDDERIEGVHVHDKNDNACNGDGVIGNACDLPYSEESARDLLLNEYLNTDGKCLDTIEWGW